MSDKSQSLFEQLSEVINGVLPGDLAADVRKNLDAALRGACDRMNLVTREELEVQEAVLQRVREKLERLETELRELEQRIGTQ